jgi:hypothetical protein
MRTIQELIEVSAYEPTGIYAQELCQLARLGTERQAALRHWLAQGRSQNSFYKAYKSLRDDLVRLAFLERKGSDLSGRRLELLDRWKTLRQLLVRGKKVAAISLAVDMVIPAIKLGNTEVALGLTALLENHYGAVEPDTRRYLRYRHLRKIWAAHHQSELDVRALQAQLVFSLSKRKAVSELASEIAALESRPQGTYTYLRYRLSVLSVWYEHRSDSEGMAIAIRQTIQAYEQCGQEVPSAALSNLYFRLTPLLSRAGRFAEAESNITRALALQQVGSHNWHLFLLQKACVGVDSGKIGMVRSALKLAHEAPREHSNDDIDRRWGVVEILAVPSEDINVWQLVLG